MGIGTDQLGFELAAVVEPNEDFVGSVDHMGIGQDVAILADDEAGAQRLALLPTPWPTATGGCREAIAEEVPEDVRNVLSAEIFEPLGAPRHHAGRRDVDHPGGRLLDQYGEIGQLTGKGRLP